jgi:arsenate reductase
MAEGFARHFGDEIVEVQSAGIEAHGKNQRAVYSMAEAGIDISGQDSTLLTYEMLEWADLVITLCGHADENCPILPDGTEKLYWPIEDPAKATGSEREIKEAFRIVREDIRVRIVELLDRIKAE